MTSDMHLLRNLLQISFHRESLSEFTSCRNVFQVPLNITLYDGDELGGSAARTFQSVIEDGLEAGAASILVPSNLAVTYEMAM